MEYVRLGPTALVVSRLCLGCWQIGGRSFGFIPDEDVRAILHQALDLGVSFFDAAPAYGRGRAEDLLGRLLPRAPEVVVATKVGLRWGPDPRLRRDLSPASVRVEIERSLTRLRREAIDLYLVHWPDLATPVAETYAELARLRSEGKIRHLGVCNHSTEQLARVAEIAGEDLVEVAQSRFNLLQQEARGEIEHCRRHGLGFMAHSVLATGLLTGRYAPGHRFDDARSRDELYAGDRMEAALRRVAALTAEASARGRTLMSAALTHVLDTPGVHTAIVGTRSAEQLAGAVRAAFP